MFALFSLITLVHTSLGFWDSNGLGFWDSKVDNCFNALRHRSRPSVALYDKMRNWETKDIWEENLLDEHDCVGDFAGCQTYSCHDENGTHIFIVNSCALVGGKCSHDDLDPICAEDGGTPKCEICNEGQCNKANIELKMPVTRTVENLNSTKTEGTGTTGAENVASSTFAN
uniref:Uncharacterized protein n=1 Tax=Globodera rostochiensis TaxID=31243 RepID=A0A914HFU8_GLORO